MNVKYERQLKKGVLEIIVLQLLLKEKMYGYQLIMTMKELSQGMFEMREGTLYPILYRLEDDEISRKYYKITEDGQKTLIELRSLWHDFSKNVNQILGDNDDE